MRWSWKSLLGVALLGLAAGSTPAVQERDGADDPIVVEARDGPIEIEKLLAIAAEVTGEPFFFEPAALHGLRARPIEAKAIPRRRLLPYLDDQLREEDFVHLERVVAGVRCHQVIAIGGSRGGGFRQSCLKTEAEIVPPDELASIADRSKLVTSTFTFRSRGFAFGMQDMVCYRFSDSATSAIRVIQGTGSFVLSGTASNVAQVVALMKELDTTAIPSEIDERDQERADALDRRITALETALAGR